jgi:hypothetical protein
VVDLSTDIFFDNHFDVLFENNIGQDMSNIILKLILSFKEDFTTKDIVLDKILSKGISSLTKFDKEILDN